MEVETFVEAIEHLETESHKNALEKGFWDGIPNIAEKIALIHSELSEALEALRSGPSEPSEKIPSFTVFEEELADVYIRLADLSAWLNLDVGAAILAKMEYNRGRPHKHGKKF